MVVPDRQRGVRGRGKPALCRHNRGTKVHENLSQKSEAAWYKARCQHNINQFREDGGSIKPFQSSTTHSGSNLCMIYACDKAAYLYSIPRLVIVFARVAREDVLMVTVARLPNHQQSRRMFMREEDDADC